MVNQLMSYKLGPSQSIISLGCSVRFLCLLELVLKHSVLMSVRETVDVF
jgi:hypothetical protein